MPKPKTIFVCSACGYESPRWYGKCPSCESWNTLEETAPQAVSAIAPKPQKQRGGTGAQAQKIYEIEAGAQTHEPTGIGEFDRVLGGGIVEGSLMLVGGEPGVGKSTLLNALLDLHLQTGEISRIERGKHTTRHAQLIEAGGLRVMDTPGFSLLEFDQVMDPVELMDYYPEFQPYQGCCRFQPCYHGSEPGCAVIQAAREGKISPARLERYHELLEKTRQLWRERYD